VRAEKGYEAARRRALRRIETGYDLGWTPPQDQDEVHDR